MQLEKFSTKVEFYIDMDLIKRDKASTVLMTLKRKLQKELEQNIANVFVTVLLH